MAFVSHCTKSNILPIINDVGEAIRKNWSKYNYTEDALPEVATHELSQSALHSQIHPEDILDLALLADPSISAYQTDSNFGDLQLILYRHARFFIEVLYWVEGTTAIHDHGFSGAFTVLHGSTINAEYGFSNINKINHHFYLGELSDPIVRQLKQGSIETIYSGKRFIHAAFHLENPTISIVVRTHQDDDAMPQFEYRGKHLRIVRDFAPEFAKKIQSLRFIELNNPKKFSNCFIRVFTDSPTDDRYWMLRAFYMSLRQDIRLWEFLLNMQKDEMVHKLLDSIEEERLLIQGVKLRANIQDPDLRYFIALLLNIPTWNGLVEFVKQQDGNIHSIQGWLNKAENLGFNLPNISGFASSNLTESSSTFPTMGKKMKSTFNELLQNRLGKSCEGISYEC